MIICGLKLTHDSSITILEDDKLIFNIEIEKLNNNNRFKIISDLDSIEVILDQFGYPLNRIDQFVIDGWVGVDSASVKSQNKGREVLISMAPYHESAAEPNVIKR